MREIRLVYENVTGNRRVSDGLIRSGCFDKSYSNRFRRPRTPNRPRLLYRAPSSLFGLEDNQSTDESRNARRYNDAVFFTPPTVGRIAGERFFFSIRSTNARISWRSDRRFRYDAVAETVYVPLIYICQPGTGGTGVTLWYIIINDRTR